MSENIDASVDPTDAPPVKKHPRGPRPIVITAAFAALALIAAVLGFAAPASAKPAKHRVVDGTATVISTTTDTPPGKKHGGQGSNNGGKKHRDPAPVVTATATPTQPDPAPTGGDPSDGSGGATTTGGSTSTPVTPAAPTAYAHSVPGVGTTGTGFHFLPSGSSDPANGTLAYHWDFGDGTSSDTAYPVKFYSTTGDFTATVTVTSSASGLSGSAPITVKVIPIPGKPKPVVKPAQPAANQTVQVPVDDISTPTCLVPNKHVKINNVNHVQTNYTQFVGGNAVHTTGEFNITPGDSYQRSYETDQGYTFPDGGTQKVDVVSNDFDSSSCQPAKAALTVSVSTGTTPVSGTANAGNSTTSYGSLSYVFIVDGVNQPAQTAATFNYTFVTPGDHTIAVQVTDQANNVDTSGDKSVHVNAIPAPVTKPYNQDVNYGQQAVVTPSNVVTNPVGATFDSATGDANGDAVVDKTGASITVTGHAGFIGKITVSYTVSNAGGSTDGTFTVTVRAIKDTNVTFAAVAVPDCPAGYSLVQYSVQHGTAGTVTLDGTTTTDNPVKVGEGQVLSVPVTADAGHTDSNGNATFSKSFTGPKVVNDCPPLNAPKLSTDMSTYTAAIGGTQMVTFSVKNTSDPAPENLPASYVITATSLDGATTYILPASTVAQDGETVTVEAEIAVGSYTATAVGSDITTSNMVSFQVIASTITNPTGPGGGNHGGTGHGGNPVTDQGSGQAAVKQESQPTGELASTGAKNVFGFVGAGAVLIALGVGLVLIARPRRQRTFGQIPVGTA